MKPALTLTAALALAAGLGLGLIQSAAPEVAPEIQPGASLRLIAPGEVGERDMLVLRRRGTWIALLPRATWLELGVVTTDPVGARTRAEADIAKGREWLEHRNGPEERAKELVQNGEKVLQYLDALPDTIAESEAERRAEYEARPLWINLQAVQGYRMLGE